MTAPVSQRLREAAAALRAERVTMRELVQAHGPEAHGTLLVLMAAPCLLPVPGVGALLGLGVAALALALWKGEAQPRLPRRVAELALPRAWAQRVLTLLASAYELAGRHARARLGHLTFPGLRPVIAPSIGLMALLVVMPIPFGNVLPALAVMLVGLGLVFRDGLAVVLGLLASALALVATVGLLLWAGSWGLEWFAGGAFARMA